MGERSTARPMCGMHPVEVNRKLHWKRDTSANHFWNQVGKHRWDAVVSCTPTNSCGVYYLCSSE